MTLRGLVFVLLAVTGCANVNESSDSPVPEESLIWPAPPNPARIQYERSVYSPRDLGFEPSFLRKLWNRIAGAAPGGMVRPYGVSAADDMLVVADPGLHGVHLYDLRAHTYTLITKIAGTDLVSPVGIGLGVERLFITDSARDQLFILDRSARHIATVKNLARPTGVAFAQDTGNLFVAQTRAHKISVFSADGIWKFDIGGEAGNAPGAFNFPTHLSLAGNTLYVNDTMNFRIQTFDTSGKFLNAFGKHGDASGYFAQSKGIGIDSEGHVYVVDAIFNNIQIFDQQGRFLLAFGKLGNKPGSFWLPAGIAVWRDHIYVADAYNRRLQVFRYLQAEEDAPPAATTRGAS